MANNKVTFYSVPGPNHSPGIIQTGINGGWLYALKNMEFLSSLNPEVHFTIILGHLVEFGDIPELPEFDNIEFEIFETTIENLNLKYPRNPSSQHGAILNYLFEKHHPKTKFFGVIDPDCYVVQFNGIRNLMSYLDESELSMIGASYPSTWDKAYYWDFPTAYFQLMNSEKILVRQWRPDADLRPPDQPGGLGPSDRPSDVQGGYGRRQRGLSRVSGNRRCGSGRKRPADPLRPADHAGR
jgi:hypothetical protein